MAATGDGPLFDPEDILARLNLDEKIQLTAGQDLWRTFASAKHAIPYAKLTDGPNGARGGGDFDDSVPAALFPSPSCIASTFNRDLAYEMGKGIALDSRSKQCHVSLAPTVNCTRDHRYGRAFENYGEDPVLSGLIGASWVTGCQSVGVAATPKHFVCNEAEEDRRFSDSQVSDAALREVYLEPFRIIFKEIARAHKLGLDGPHGQAFKGQPGCVMTAYNQINGVSASEHEHTLLEILRTEWQWDGLVMSDWFALHDSALKTTDLEMPGPAFWRRVGYVEDKLAKGEFTEQDVEQRTLKVLQLLCKVAPLTFCKGPADEHEESVIDEEREETIRKIAAEGAVLLKNEGSLLPLTKEKLNNVKKIALIGKPWKQPIQSGGGSANLTPQIAKPAIESLDQALKDCGAAVELVYHDGCDIHNFPAAPSGPPSLPGKVKIEYFAGRTAPAAGDDSRPVLISTTTDSPSKGAMSSTPEECEPNNFSLRAFFELISQSAGSHTLGVVCYGALDVVVTRSNGERALEWGYKGEEDIFEFFLNEYKFAAYKTVDLAKDETVTVTVSYSPAEAPPFVAGMRPAGFRVGFEEYKDHQSILSSAADLAAEADLAIVFTGLGKEWESEGYDRPDLNLPRMQDALIERVSEKQPQTIVVNASGAAIELPWLDSVRALLQVWYGGQEAGEAVVDCLLGRGRAPASGRLCATWPRRCADQPAGNDPVKFPGRDLTGRGHPDVKYDEGRLVGYKWYEAKSLAPAFWLGGGLGGYTTFERQLNTIAGQGQGQGQGRHLTLVKQGSVPAKIEVQVQVTNTGFNSGKDVIQLYLEFPKAVQESEADLPKRKLVAFSTVYLDVGSSRTVTLQVEEDLFSHWSEQGKQWKVGKGTYTLAAATSANVADVYATLDVVVDQPWSWNGLGQF